MRYRRTTWLVCAMAASALVFASAPAHAAPGIAISAPAAGAVVLDAAPITITITSPFLLSSVVASVGSATTSLSSETGPTGTTWTGTIDLTAQPAGAVTLTVVATDVTVESSVATVAVVHTRTPTVTVDTPRESVARPCLHLKVTCTSIDGQPCDVLEVRTRDLERIVTSVKGTGAAGPLILDRTVSLTEWEGQHTKLVVAARNSAGAMSALQDIPFYVDSSPTLIAVDEVDGRILDFDDQRILFVGASGVALEDRTTKVVTPLGAGSPQVGVLLAGGGALWEGGEWKGGAFLGNDISALRTSGTWATFVTGSVATGRNVQRRDLTTGATALVGPGYSPDIDESGTLVYMKSIFQGFELHRVDAAGVDEIVRSFPAIPPVFFGQPHVGGDALTWAVGDGGGASQVYLLTSAATEPETFLWPTTIGRPLPPYLLRVGWFANVRMSNGGAAAWTRSPSGKNALAGVHAGVSAIVALEPDGSIAYDAVADGKSSRYFGGAGASAPVPPVRIGAGFGRLVHRGAVWYQIVERVLYRVDTSVTTPLPACGDPSTPDGGVGSSGGSSGAMPLGAQPPSMASSADDDAGCASAGRDPSSSWVVGLLAAVGLVAARRRRRA